MKRKLTLHPKIKYRALFPLIKRARFILLCSFALLFSAAYLSAQSDIRVDLSDREGSATGNWNTISVANANSTTSNLIDHTTGSASSIAITGSGWEGEWSGGIPSGEWFDGGSGMYDRLYCYPNTPAESPSFTFSNLDNSKVYQIEIVSDGDGTYSLITANGNYATRSYLGNSVNPWYQNNSNDWLIWERVSPVSGQIVISMTRQSGSYLNMNLIRLSEAEAEYTITYNLDGGTNNVSNPATYTESTADITLADATKDAYTFAGWFSDEALTTQVTGIEQGSTGDVTLWAKWTAVDYSISYNLDGGTNDAANPASYNIETADITLADATKDAYTFAGWFSDEALTTQVSTIVQGSSGDVTLWAKWTAVDYSISYNLDGGTNDAANPASYNIETADITLADATKDAYTFAGWFSDEALTTQVTGIEQGSTGDVTLWAKWTAVDYSISYNLDGGTNDAANPASYNIETADITLADATKDAYTFAGWFSDEALTTQVTGIDQGSTGDVTLWAKWTAVDYAISYNLDGGTNDAVNPAGYNIETADITLADATKDAYTFAGWFSDEALTTQVSTIAQGSTGDVSLWAKWTIVDYAITYNLDGGTNDAANPAVFNIETADITLADATKDGYTFAGWFSDDAFTTQVPSIGQGSTGDVSLWAKWTATDYAITYDLDGGTNDAANPASYTVETADITLAEATKDGYAFAGWFSDDAYTTQVTSIDQGSTGDVSLWAKWESTSSAGLDLSTPEISIYPNPTSDVIYIETSEKENLSIKLMNINGSIILDKVKPNTQIDLSGFPNGIYFLNVNMLTYKIIKN